MCLSNQTRYFVSTKLLKIVKSLGRQLLIFISLSFDKSIPKSFPGDHSKWVPPDPLPNSEVKLLSADGSVGSPHVRVGHCQGFIEVEKAVTRNRCSFFFACYLAMTDSHMDLLGIGRQLAA